MEICPICERKIRSVKQWHFCAKVNLEDLFIGKEKQVLFMFDKLLAELIDWPNLSYSGTKNCIVFVKQKTFLVVKPMKKELDLKFYLPYYSEEFPIYKSNLWSGKYETHIRLSDLDDLDNNVI